MCVRPVLVGLISKENLFPVDNLTLKQQAIAILKANGKEGYTLPTADLYPFQWYWDSVITALGWQTFDEERAWEELEYIMKGQWNNGFIPHIIFHKQSNSYFPGPDTWGTLHNRVETEDIPIPSSRISQPPIIALGYWQLFNKSSDKQKYYKKLQQLFPSICKHYMWWIENRQLTTTKGLLASIHPWETGMDNSPVWDKPLRQVPAFQGEYLRKDTALVNPDERPTNEQYDKYLHIVELLKNGTANSTLAQQGPFSVHDLCIISLFHSSCQDLQKIGNAVGLEVPADITLFMHDTEKNIHKLWNEEGYFQTWDCLTDEALAYKISASFLPLYAELATQEQAAKMNHQLEISFSEAPFGVASTFADEPSYESNRYWRGPVWFHINWLIAQGLRKYGFDDTADKIKQSTMQLAEKSGFSEYYDSQTGSGCGGGNFSWTAATWLIWQ